MSLPAIALGNAALASLLMAAAVLVARRGRRPRWVHALWVLALLKLVLPLAVTVPLWPAASRDAEGPPSAGALAEAPAGTVPRVPAARDAAPAGDAPSPLDQGAPVFEVSPAMPLEGEGVPGGNRSAGAAAVLFDIWIAGAIFVLLAALSRLGSFDRGVSRAALAPRWLEDRVAVLAGRAGIRRPPEVRVLGERLMPCVAALFGRAQLVVPAGLLHRLCGEELDTLLLHELVHLRRRDHWVRRLEIACAALFWWLPPLWWARPHARAAEEECCDAEVVALLGGDGRTYARALVDTVDYLAGAPRVLPLAVSGLGAGPVMRRRVMRILEGDVMRRAPRAARIALLCLAAALCAFRPGAAQEAPRRASPWEAGVVARLDGEAITQADLLDAVVARRRGWIEREVLAWKVAEDLLAEQGLVLAEDELEAARKELRIEGPTGDARLDEHFARAARAQAAWIRLYREKHRRSEGPVQPFLLQKLMSEAIKAAAMEVTDAELRAAATLVATPAHLAQALDDVIDARLLERKRARAGGPDPAAEVLVWAEEQRAKHQPPFTWEAVCRVKGTSTDAEVVRRRQVLIVRHLAGGPPDEAVLRAFRDEHGTAFRHGHRKASVIAIHFATPFRDGPRSEAEARARAGEIHRRLEQGEPFADLARSMSDDATTAASGGRLVAAVDSLARFHPPAVVDVVFTLEGPASFSAPFRTADAWMIVRLDEVSPPTLRAGADDPLLTNPRYAEWIFDECEEARRRAVVAGLRAQARIELAPKIRLD